MPDKYTLGYVVEREVEDQDPLWSDFDIYTEIEEYPSDYEDEQGNHYVAGAVIGDGDFDVVRSLDLVTYEESEEVAGKYDAYVSESNWVVLKPKDEHAHRSIYAKCPFYTIFNPEPGQVRLFEFPGEKTIRLIVPRAFGALYSKLDINSLEEMITVCLSAIKEIKICHAASRIIIDLKSENIFYNTQTKKSTLIDGGSSLIKGEFYYKRILTSEEIQYKRERSSHMAPERWLGAAAHESMDVYSFGMMMLRMIKVMQRKYPIQHIDYLKELMTACINKIPQKRPTFEELEYKLSRYFVKIKYGYDDAFSSDETEFAKVNDEKVRGKFALSFFATTMIDRLAENTAIIHKNNHKKQDSSLEV